MCLCLWAFAKIGTTLQSCWWSMTPYAYIQDYFTAALSASPLSPIDQDKAGGNVSSLRSHLVTRKSAPGMNIRQLNNSSIYSEDTPQKSILP